ncbi:MAG: small basic protein [Sedimentisphaerales bacterium]|nr:small basic protein [Sedimentisphaerales bacterium]
MSLDRSLKSSDALSRHRNVLTRMERLEILVDEGRWSEQNNSVFGLPKVAHRKLAAGKKTKKKDAEEEKAAEAKPAAGTGSTG